MNSLPVELIEHVLSSTDAHGLWTLSCVDKAFRVAVARLKRRRPTHRVYRAWEAACLSGSLSSARALLARGKRGCLSRDFEAASASDVEFVRWLHAHRLQLNSDFKPRAIVRAAAAGKVDVLRFLCSRLEPQLQLEPQWMRGALAAAASNGHASSLVFLLGLDEGEPPLTVDDDMTLEIYHPLDLAASNGHLDIVRLLESRGAKRTASALDLAAENGHASVVRYLVELDGALASARAIDGAAGGGHYEIVELLIARGFPSTIRAMDSAAAGGHVRVLSLLAAHGQECSCRAMDGAAGEGHVSTLEWLAARGHHCTSMASIVAAGNNHVDALAYMFLHFRHEFDVGRAMDIAVLWDAHDAQEWLVDNAGATYAGLF